MCFSLCIRTSYLYLCYANIQIYAKRIYAGLRFFHSLFFSPSIFFIFDIVPSWRSFAIHAHHIPACFIVYKLLPIQRDRLPLVGRVLRPKGLPNGKKKRNEICVRTGFNAIREDFDVCYEYSVRYGMDRCPSDILAHILWGSFRLHNVVRVPSFTIVFFSFWFLVNA